MGISSKTNQLGNSISTAELEDNSVTLAKIAGGTANQIIGYDASGDPEDRAAPSSDSQVNDQVYSLDTTIGNYAVPVAPVASSELINDDFQDTFITDDWTDTGTNVKVNTSTEVVDFTLVGDKTGTMIDLLGANVSETEWACRFKLDITSLTGGLNRILYMILSSTTSRDHSVANDHLGYYVATNTTVMASIAGNGSNVNASTLKTDFSRTVSVEILYVEMKRTSATSFTVSLYSDAGYSSLLEAKTETITTGYTALRYLKFLCLDIGATGAMVGTIDNVRFVDGTTTFPAVSAALKENIIDTDTDTTWQSNSENNPNIYVDCEAAKEIVGIALNIDTVNTTETELDIRISTDTTFTSAEDVRSLLISDFTDNTWRFISIPRLGDDRRYIQIRGVNSSKVLAIHEIKYISKTDFDRKHYHKYLDPTSTTATSEDSN